MNGLRYPPREGSLSSPPPGAENLKSDAGFSPDSDYGKPTPKQFQSNTITPNKSTMVEDEEDDLAVYDGQFDNDRQSDAYGLDGQVGVGMQSRRDTSATNRSVSSSAVSGKLADAQAKVQELQSKIEDLEINLSLKDDEIGRLQDVEQGRSTESDWIDVRQDLQKRLEDAEMLNQSMKDQLDQTHTDQANVERDLRSQLDKAKRSQAGDEGWKAKYEELERDYQALQARLREQQQVTEEVRQQASGFLSEMRTMAESGGSNWEREEKLAKDVRRLEEEVKEWKGRYAKSKAQLRNLRASSIGLSMSRPNAARYAKANEFTQPDGLVKDVHVTKFQISIDELLMLARTEDPSAVLGHMKFVVVAVRSITQDIDTAGPADKEDEKGRRRGKLKSKVSATANNVITASKNFASSNGISPVSLLDAAASHLTMAVVELVREVKIRPTPPGELDDEDEALANAEPMQNPTYFQVESGHMRNESTNESVYSAVSISPASAGSSGATVPAHLRSSSKTSSDSTNAIGYGGTGGLESGAVKLGFGMRAQDDGELEELKVRIFLLYGYISKLTDSMLTYMSFKLYLEDQTDSLVRSIQSLVGSIRAEEDLPQIRTHISTIANVVGEVVSATEKSLPVLAPLRGRVEPIVHNLANCNGRLMSANAESERLGDKGRVRSFMSRLPPLAFEIARETKELVQRVDMADQEQRQREEDYS